MNDEIGNMAGVVWTVLHSRGEMTVAQLKKEAGAKSPLLDWAIGWLAREGNIALTPDKRTFRIRLK